MRVIFAVDDRPGVSTTPAVTSEKGKSGAECEALSPSILTLNAKAIVGSSSCQSFGTSQLFFVHRVAKYFTQATPGSSCV